MNESITLRDVEAPEGQSLLPGALPPPREEYSAHSTHLKLDDLIPTGDHSKYLDGRWIPPAFLEIWAYMEFYGCGWMNVAAQLAPRSQDIALKCQAVAVLDDILSKIDIALQDLDVDEDSFLFVSALFDTEHHLRCLRFHLFPYLPDLERITRAYDFRNHFFVPSDPLLKYFPVDAVEQWSSQNSKIEDTGEQSSQLTHYFSQWEEILDRAVQFVQRVRRDSYSTDIDSQVEVVNSLNSIISLVENEQKFYSTLKGVWILQIAGVLSIQGTLEAYRLCFLKLIDDVAHSICILRTISLFGELFDPFLGIISSELQRKMDYSIALSIVEEEEYKSTNSLISEIHYSPSKFLYQVLLYVSKQLELQSSKPQSELYTILVETTHIINAALEIIGIDESAFEVIVCLLLFQVYTSIVFSQIHSHGQRHFSLILQLETIKPYYSNYINFIFEILPHFYKTSEYATGYILELAERFQWPSELSACFILSDIIQNQNINDLVYLENYIPAQYSQFTSTKLAIAIKSLVSTSQVIVPKERTILDNLILRLGKIYLSGIKDIDIYICLRTYGIQLALKLYQGHNNCLDLNTFNQTLILIDCCFQNHTDNQRSQTVFIKGSNLCSHSDKESFYWQLYLIHILYKLLTAAVIAGDMKKIDTVLKYLEVNTLPYEQYGMYEMYGTHELISINNISPIIFQPYLTSDWISKTLLNKSIVALKQQFQLTHLSETYKAIIAFVLATSLFRRESLAITLILPFSLASANHYEAYPYFIYFLEHWHLSKTSVWIVPSCKILYKALYRSELMSGNLIKTSVHNMWNRWTQSSDILNKTFKRNESHLQQENIERKDISALINRFSQQKNLKLKSSSQVKNKKIDDIRLLMNWNKIYTGSPEDIKNGAHVAESLIQIASMGRIYNLTKYADSTKLFHTLYRLEQIIDRLRIPLSNRVDAIILWYIIILFILNRVWKVNVLTDFIEYCDKYLSKLSVISWAVLEEMSWIASSVWESIADRQGVSTSLLQFLIMTVTINKSPLNILIEINEIWEGQGLIWTQLYYLRAPVDHLARVDPRLANHLQTLQKAFEQQWVQIDDDEQRGLKIQYYEKSNIELYQEWVELLAKIHSLSGFETFLKEKTFNDLIKVSRDGPVVFLIGPHNSTLGGSWPSPDIMAFIFYHRNLGNNQEEPTVVRVLLPLLTIKSIIELHRSLTTMAKTRHSSNNDNDLSSEGANEHLSARAFSSDPDPPESSEQGCTSRMKIISRKTQKTRMLEILKELWKAVAEPILDNIMQIRGGNVNVDNDDKKGKAKAWHWQDKPPPRDERGRIWWCCLGEFSFLPIHAAGVYRDDGSSTCVSDFFISSYTPSLSALIDARNRPLPQPEDIKVLAAAQPKPDPTEESKWKPLPSTRKELEEIAGITPKQNLLYLDGQDQLDFTGEHTTVQNVLQVLPQASILHLACHGEQDRGNPVKSGFILKNRERLTIQELIKQRTPNAYMAILSACHTASNDALQPEESMNLTRTAIFLGFSTILGTKWHMADADGPALAKAVYTALFAALNPNSESDQHLDGGDVASSIDTARSHPHNPLESFCLAKVVDDFVYSLRKRPGVPATRWATFVHIGI